MPDLVPKLTLSVKPVEVADDQIMEEMNEVNGPENLEGGYDVDDDWVEFDVMEIEEALRRKKDPRSFSEPFCFGKCLVGPPEKKTSSIVANSVNIIMIMFNIVAMTYSCQGAWSWLISLNIIIGILTQILMWCV